MTKLPVSGNFKITCEFNKKGSTWKAGRHTGVDIVSNDKIVYGTGRGVVTQTGYDKSYGKFVVVKINDFFHWFCHLSRVYVQKGEQISYATKIGFMGRTGNASGIHLHWEIRKACNCYNEVINPCDYAEIPNKIGNYDSYEYEIKFSYTPKKTDYLIGEKVLVKALDCGSRRQIGIVNQVMVEVPYLQTQIWVNENDFINNKLVCTIFWIENDILSVDISGYFQFSINHKEVEKICQK